MYAHHHYGYQEPHYGGSQYYQPPQHQPLPPPLPPQYHPEITFKSDYAARLAELTANSRPIIQSLTVIAQDYTQYADIVAECIEAHVRRVSTLLFWFYGVSARLGGLTLLGHRPNCLCHITCLLTQLSGTSLDETACFLSSGCDLEERVRAVRTSFLALCCAFVPRSV